MQVMAIDFFCGAGGFSAGMMQSGIKIYAGFDNWPIAIKTYNHNIKSHYAYDVDLTLENMNLILQNYKPDLVFGGPPCQDFSVRGSNKTAKKRTRRNDRFSEMVESCIINQVPSILIENVPNIRNFEQYQLAIEQLVEADYMVRDRVINTSAYGIPQHRRRNLLYATRGGFDLFQALESYKVPRPVSVKEYLGVLMPQDAYYMFLTGADAIRIRNAHEPCTTIIRASFDDWQDRPLDVPRLSIMQGSAIQTFPGYWEWPNQFSNIRDTQQMIANAFPSLMAYKIGRALQH